VSAPLVALDDRRGSHARAPSRDVGELRPHFAVRDLGAREERDGVVEAGLVDGEATRLKRHGEIVHVCAVELAVRVVEVHHGDRVGGAVDVRPELRACGSIAADQGGERDSGGEREPSSVPRSHRSNPSA
jgi:hypothetical protein